MTTPEQSKPADEARDSVLRSGAVSSCNDLLEVNVNDSQKESHNELHLFAGSGGGILGGILLGHTTVCAVEINPYCRSVLLQRQRDGILPHFPIWDDVTTFDGTPWRGIVRTVCGGFPCQDISVAGKGAGIGGERSGLWGQMARIIGEIRPEYVFVENSPEITARGLGRVLADLSGLGFSTRWGVLGGFNAGLCANRKRFWGLATRSNGVRQFRPTLQIEKSAATTSSKRQFERVLRTAISDEDHARIYRDSERMARGVERLKAIGNGQVPVLAALAWRTLHAQLTSNGRDERQTPGE